MISESLILQLIHSNSVLIQMIKAKELTGTWLDQADQELVRKAQELNVMARREAYLAGRSVALDVSK